MERTYVSGNVCESFYTVSFTFLNATRYSYLRQRETHVLCGLGCNHLITFPAVVQAGTGRDSFTEHRSRVTQLLSNTDKSQVI